ncbi:inositol monophosphatase [Salipaludibacillus keqinensis]|uniref:Inositol monophosphatase n=1 Tax=Salipaludibacillus keqinensis TaxID=2045207 RepID=A0A323TRP1_9BACI|nr:inositol monophosphatase family protein [Salipaludibacillus keqinensis]PYZ92035.1 inositol monophosphatase [Salipaludibacillus keqinensis]
MEYQEIYRLTKEWAYEAGEILREAVSQEITVEYKTSAADLVTEKDKEIEAFFANKINETFPHHFLLGEEGVASNQADYDPHNEIVWLVDPIDGTTNFVHNKRNFCISVGVFDRGQPIVGVVYDPMADQLFHTLKGNGVFIDDEFIKPSTMAPTSEQALISMNHLWLAPNEYLHEQPLQKMATDIRGFRCLGSAALELANVAVGRLDGAIFIGLGPWDFGAAYVLLKEQGIHITTVDGEQIDVFHPSSVLTAKKELHHSIRSNYIRTKK